MHQIVSNPDNHLPQLAPDGNYCPSDSIGDVNEDGAINILDVITIINMIFDTNSANQNADVNIDGLIDILDIITVVNIILGDN